MDNNRLPPTYTLIASIAVLITGISIGYTYFIGRTLTSQAVPASAATTPSPTSDQAAPDVSLYPVQTVDFAYTSGGFVPGSITIPVNSTVTWRNQTQNDLVIESLPGSGYDNYSPLDIGSLSPNESRSIVFIQKGSFRFNNALIPGHVGTIVVQ